MKIGTYYYPGWHPCKVRDIAFPKKWSEWSLVRNGEPRFDGHEQPKIPLWGYQNEANPTVFSQKIDTAFDYGVDFFVFAFYWSRGRQLLNGALNHGYLGAKNRNKTKFALMWANRMPRRVMPVKDVTAKVIDPTRLVYTDPEDFLEFITCLADKYFILPEYYRIDGACYLSIFDTAFFIRQLGAELATITISRARKLMASRGLNLHLAAIDPIFQHRPLLKQIGFNSITHYVFLPDWSGSNIQDYEVCANARAEQWHTYQTETGLPYAPSISTGWDATPRAVDYGKEKPGRYPWSPVVTGSNPEKFGAALKVATNYARYKSNFSEPMIMIASWNEWSEGHYLEPDHKHGYGWLEAIKTCKNG